MAVAVEQRVRARVGDLPSSLPTVAPFDGEEAIDAAKEANKFISKLSKAVEGGDWNAFGDLFLKDAFWKDSLTLTFDKRTLDGKERIIEAWKSISSTRKVSAFTSQKDQDMTMDPVFMRMGPSLACLDVPFSFITEAPRSKCIGLAKLVPDGNDWKVWILATSVISLEEHPFEKLPRQSPSIVDAYQKGKSKAQGLPKINGVLDAIVVGGGCSGLGSTIMLESIGANVATFDIEQSAGGQWSTKRYQGITLHHPAFMCQLPMFPVPEGYPDFLPGPDINKYFCAAVEALDLPFFGGIRVMSNRFDESTNLWTVVVRDLATNAETTLQAKNLVISTGFLVSPDNPNIPTLKDQQLFKGPVEHTTQYRTPDRYKGKDVLIIGSGNSAHDVASNLVSSGAGSVTILQRSPTALFDFGLIAPLLTMRYSGAMPVDTADFLETSLPMGIAREMAHGAISSIVSAMEERYELFEKAGYMIDRTPCLISRAYEERGRSFYCDQPNTFELVLKGKIKIARGEATGFTENGVVAHDKETGEDKVIPAGGVVLATGYKEVDLPAQWAQSGFFDEKSASVLENVSKFGVDNEGEIPGYVTFSGHPHLYFSGIGFYGCRWIGRFTSIQLMADVTGKFPKRYPRSST